MKTKSAKHNLIWSQMSGLADVLGKGKQQHERDFSFSWSRPCAVDFPYNAGSQQVKEA